MKTIQIKTVRIIGQNELGESKFESIIQKITEGANFAKFCKYLASHGYKSVTVVNVVYSESKEISNKEVSVLIAKYQSEIDAVIKPVKQPETKGIDPKISKELEETKSALQKQIEINEANDKRLKELESKLAGIK